MCCYICMSIVVAFVCSYLCGGDWLFLFVCVCLCKRLCVAVYICLCVHVCYMCVYKCLSMNIHIQVCVCVCISNYLRVCHMPACVSVFAKSTRCSVPVKRVQLKTLMARTIPNITNHSVQREPLKYSLCLWKWPYIAFVAIMAINTIMVILQTGEFHLL